LRAFGVSKCLAFLTTQSDFEILVEILLMWALKLSVGSRRTPRNFITGLEDRLKNSICEKSVFLGHHNC
jgi:hypothetical protein